VTTGWWAIDSVRVTSSHSTTTGGRFVRGDTDGSGQIDITDPINNLSYQFLGEFKPSCLDAMDDDDSGKVDISDPIFSLNRQFLGGPVWAPPYPACGTDPTPDQGTDLGCASDAACR
jgi:hypothetical protein